MDITQHDWCLMLQEARWKAGPTQEELALMSGVSTRSISDIERGRAIPRATTARLLADTLGMGRAGTEKLLVAARMSWRSQ